jgi:hypothetical protein
MRAVKNVAFILLFAAAGAFAQNTSAPSGSSLKTDCTKIELTLSCGSFNEMVEGNDKDLLSAIQGFDHAFVCFRTDEDTFIVVSISTPYTSTFRKSATDKSLSTAYGRVRYKRYKDGVSDYIRFGPGSWVRSEGISDSFETKEGAPVSAFMDDDELNISFKYANIVKTTSDYNLTIRRSTRRFTETVYVKETRPGKPDYKSTETGHCTEFLPNSK